MISKSSKNATIVVVHVVVRTEIPICLSFMVAYMFA
jgi:hypothetical protein